VYNHLISGGTLGEALKQGVKGVHSMPESSALARGNFVLVGNPQLKLIIE